MSRRADDPSLEDRPFTYSEVGATEVARATWPSTSTGFRRYERTVAIGTAWEDARLLMLRWAVKTRSGFIVDSAEGAAHLALPTGHNIPTG